jgi:3',5'-cyclic AMP phosphodiesterase CpdA
MDAKGFRLVHVSDIHFWEYAFNPLQLFSKRLLGMGSLIVRRARRFRLERMEQVIDRILLLRPDHVLITGDLTTTALPVEFRRARRALEPLIEAAGVTALPGNHDRYTGEAHRGRVFERFFGDLAPSRDYPWMRDLGDGLGILGLDPTRASLTARGELPERQLQQAKRLLEETRRSVGRLIVACHYPLDCPAAHARDLASKRLINAGEVRSWLSTVGPHLFCCGHVHAAWAHVPHEIPRQLCLNAGAPLLRDPSGQRPPGFLEIVIRDRDVLVRHHGWTGSEWGLRTLHESRGFFDAAGDGVARVRGEPAR